MLGVALIVGAVLLYKVYKLTLKHNHYLHKPIEQNRRLQAEVEEWKAWYEALQHSSEPDTAQERIRQIAKKSSAAKPPFSKHMTGVLAILLPAIIGGLALGAFSEWLKYRSRLGIPPEQYRGYKKTSNFSKMKMKSYANA